MKDTAAQKPAKTLIEVIQRIKPDQFEFTVEAKGTPFDIYWFEHDFKVGQTALAKIGGKAVVAMFKPGRMTAEEVTKYLEAQPDLLGPSEDL